MVDKWLGFTLLITNHYLSTTITHGELSTTIVVDSDTARKSAPEYGCLLIIDQPRNGELPAQINTVADFWLQIITDHAKQNCL